MSQQAKAKRDSAILEQHKKGLSGRAISKMFGVAVMTVSDIISKTYENPESGKSYTPNETTAVPLASTERGADTLDTDGIGLTDASASILSDYSHIIDGAWPNAK